MIRDFHNEKEEKSYWFHVYLVFRLISLFFHLFILKGKYYTIVLARKRNVKKHVYNEARLLHKMENQTYIYELHILQQNFSEFLWIFQERGELQYLPVDKKYSKDFQYGIWKFWELYARNLKS